MAVLRRLRKARARVRGTSTVARDAGFTLIEAIVSFVIFAVVAAAATRAVYNALQASHTTQQRVDAANTAQQFIAQAIANANLIAPEAGVSHPANVGDGTVSAEEDFTVTRTITFDGNETTCRPGALYTVNIVVTQAQTGKFLARSDTRVACPPA